MESVTRVSAETYSQISSFQREVGRKLISKLHITKGAKILDLGCGTGETTIELSELVGTEGRIIAVDPDADRIKLAKKNNARVNIDFIVGNDQTFPEDQYDIVFMNCVIHWVVDKLALYKRVYNNIRPGGSFAFSTNDGEHPILPVTNRLCDLIHPNFFEDFFWKRVNFINQGKYLELQKSTAFETRSSETKRMHVHCENTEACLDWYFGGLQGKIELSSVDPQALQTFKKDYDEEVRNNPMPFDMLFVVYLKPN